DALKFRQLLTKHGLKLEPTMVANRGFHNPDLGSFSIFEIVSGQINDITPYETVNGNESKVEMSVNRGDFFFGHFTTIDRNGRLIADQNPEQKALMLEAFAWDPQNQLY